MSDATYLPLRTLIHRTRSALWRQRLIRWLWYGACISAVTLLAASVIRISLFGFSMPTLITLALAPPLLAALYVLLVRRPSCDHAAAELDHRGDYNNLWITAWEALAIPQSHRLAGAEVALQQANVLAPQISSNETGTAASSFRGPYFMVPWSLMLIALFLLQLPAMQTDRLVDNGTKTAGYSNIGGSPQYQSALQEKQQTAEMADVTSVSGTQATRNTTMPPSDTKVPADVVQKSPEERTPAGETRIRAANKSQEEPPQGSGKPVSNAESEDIDTSPGNTENTQLSVQYENVTRHTAGTAQQSVAGSGSMEMAKPTATTPDTGQARGSSVQVEPGTVPYSNHYSLPEQLQIRSYFRHLGESP